MADLGTRMDLSVIYPAYNEEENIRLIPGELLSYLDKTKANYEVVIVDDGSLDSTYKEALKLASRYKRIRIARHKKNQGLGAAVRTGIKAAKGRMIVTIDGDFTFHPRQIKMLYDEYRKGGADCIIGSPSLKGYDKSVPSYRIFLSKAANLIHVMLLGKRITAVTPIFRLYDAKKLKSLRLESNRFEINAEILYKWLIKGYTVKEVPALLTTRKHGISKLNNLREIKNHLLLMLKAIKWRIAGS